MKLHHIDWRRIDGPAIAIAGEMNAPSVLDADINDAGMARIRIKMEPVMSSIVEHLNGRWCAKRDGIKTSTTATLRLWPRSTTSAWASISMSSAPTITPARPPSHHVADALSRSNSQAARSINGYNPTRMTMSHSDAMSHKKITEKGCMLKYINNLTTIALRQECG